MSVFPRKKSKTQSSLNFLQSGPRKFSKSDFSGLAPIRRVLICASLRNETAAQRVSSGAGYPADVHADIPADVWWQKLRSGPRNPGKNKPSGADIHDPKAQTSTSPGGFQKNFGQKTFAPYKRPLPRIRKEKQPVMEVAIVNRLLDCDSTLNRRGPVSGSPP